MNHEVDQAAERGRPRIPPEPGWMWWSLLAAAALIPRLVFLARWPVNLDSDEALVGIQAGRILHGHWSVFLPGQCYMGTLESLLAAPWIALLRHPVAVRFSPLLWVVPGWLVLRALVGSEAGPSAAGAPAASRRIGFWLAVTWALPTPVLWLAGLKARGGYLEGLTLGLGAAVLLWPRAGGAAGAHANGRGGRRTILRAFLGGLLFGLAWWTSDQSLLFAPWLAVALLTVRSGRAKRSGAALAGVLIGYAPLWWPRLAPFALGPPGLQGTELQWSLAAPFSLEGLLRLAQIILAAATARADLHGAAAIPALLYVLLLLSLLGAALRRRQAEPPASLAADASLRMWPRRLGGRWVEENPALALTGWMALATTGALLASPDAFQDAQWFRYTLSLSPLFAVGAALALARMAPRPAAAVASLLALLSVYNFFRAPAAWEYRYADERVPLARELDRSGVRRVRSDWQTAQVLRWFSGDRVLAASSNPTRFPEVNAAVDFASASWDVGARVEPLRQADVTRAGAGAPGVGDSSEGKSGAGAPDSGLDRLRAHFVIAPHQPAAPPAVSAAFDSLDLSRTLFARLEPFPLLDPSVYRRDWRGWPYRRPLDRFDAIVWTPDPADDPGPIPAAVVEAALRDQVRRGRFVRTAAWARGEIYRRVGGPASGAR